MDSLYKNLPEENRSYLVNLIDRIKKETNLLSISLSQTEKTRRTFKNKILFSLLYGIEEIKMHLNDEEYWNEINSEQKNTIKELLNNQQEQTKYCQELALQIETMVFFESKEKISELYKKKLYDLCLNMLDNKNEILRKKVLFGIIKYEQLVKMSAEELAPPEEQKKLKEQRKKFFKEQMFLTEEMKVVNHKEVTSNTLVNKEYNEEAPASYDLMNYPRQSQNNLVIKKKKENTFSKEKINEIKNNNDKNIQKEKSKLSGLSSEMLKFYFEVDEFRKETLIKKINDKINGNLKQSTVDEINEKRKLFNVNLNI
jgi:hypothetical protein